MMKIHLLLVCSLLMTTTVAFSAQWPTPGTGVTYTLDSLVAKSGGVVLKSGTDYVVTDTVIISENDTLSITDDAVVKFTQNSFFWVKKGVFTIAPPTMVVLTAENIATGFLGVRLDSSMGSSFKKMVFEYAVSFRLTDSKAYFEQCTFQYNNVGTSTSFGNGAIALFRSSPVIENCRFLFNRRSAIQGGANIANAPKIFNSLFEGNNTTGQNVPQINLGATSAGGADTVKIINSQIINAGSTNAGGIGFLPVGEVYALITGNTIRNNRYGLTFNGAQNIHAYVGYNVIDSNNIQGNPALGGSGISFTGGSPSSVGQNVIVSNNILRANLWGITIQGRSRPNVGNISNSDTTDDGRNMFINNNNASTPLNDFYNNSPDDVFAQNNYWNTDIPDTAEARIFHNPDLNTLGFVNYLPIMTSEMLPVTLTNFTVWVKDEQALLSWQTLSEENSSHFNVQRSFNGKEFLAVGSVAAAGHSNKTISYRFTDGMQSNEGKHFYRVEMVDKDGTKKYSPVRMVTAGKAIDFSFYPNPAKDYVVVDAKDAFLISIVDGNGRTVFSQKTNTDQNILGISQLAAGTYYLVVKDNSGQESSKKLVKP